MTGSYPHQRACVYTSQGTVQIVGAQYNGTHAQLGQHSQEWGPPECYYYGSVIGTLRQHRDNVVDVGFHWISAE